MKEKFHKMLMGLGALACCLTLAHAYQYDAQLEAGVMHFLQNGVHVVDMFTNPSGNASLHIGSSQSLTGVDAITISTNGYAKMHAVPLSQTETPGSAGELLYSQTNKFLCISTGTNIGAWVIVSSGSPTLGTGNTVPCP